MCVHSGASVIRSFIAYTSVKVSVDHPRTECRRQELQQETVITEVYRDMKGRVRDDESDSEGGRRTSNRVAINYSHARNKAPGCFGQYLPVIDCFRCDATADIPTEPSK